MSKVHNYSAGPCILPQEVFQEASNAVLDFNNSGLSILEISHRSPDFVAVMEEARQLVKDILKVPEGYTVLFLQGGASTGFLTAAYNMLTTNGKAAYVNTGSWSTKAIKEAKKLGNADEIASSADKNFNYIPKNYDIPAGADYLHLTSNNTIFGTQIKMFPKTDVPVLCDMSSDIFSREINVADFDLIYAGAQKNLGPAGATLYIVKESVFQKSGRDIPSMLDLEIHHKKDSMFNTPPVYSVYVSMLNLRYMIKQGGLAAMQKKAEQRAELIYREIERNPLFEAAVPDIEDRSKMNATFVLKDEVHKDRFDLLVKEARINGLKGHRSVGGYRASMYNALPVDSVQVLVETMQELEKGA